MSEVLFEVAGVDVTVTGVYAVISVVVLFLFMSLWLIGRKKRSGREIFAGQVMNGIGFGLLPALAVLKAFQEAGTGTGSKVLEPLPCIRWLSVNGYYMPGRIETCAAAVMFLLVCLWLIFRRNELPDNGDLIMITVCIWAAIRLVTEDFRIQPMNLFRFTSCGTMLACAVLWSVRRARYGRMTVRTVVDLAAVCICIAINLITSLQIVSAGSGIADYAVKTGSAALLLLLTLMIGGDLPKNDDFTLGLLTNAGVLSIEKESWCARPLYTLEEEDVWLAPRMDGKGVYVAAFNLSDVERVIRVSLPGERPFSTAKELWTGKDGDELCAELPAHDAAVWRLQW